MKATYKNIPEWDCYYDIKGGCIYRLTDKLTSQDKELLLNKFNNIELLVIQSEYAPELIKNGILIKNK